MAIGKAGQVTTQRQGKQQRNEAIRRDYREQGLTVRELIELYGLSESQIRRIISKVG